MLNYTYSLLNDFKPPASVDKSHCVFETVSSNVSMCTVRVVRPVNCGPHHLNLALLCFTAFRLY